VLQQQASYGQAPQQVFSKQIEQTTYPPDFVVQPKSTYNVQKQYQSDGQTSQQYAGLSPVEQTTQIPAAFPFVKSFDQSKSMQTSQPSYVSIFNNVSLTKTTLTFS
jgi:hypothetical protein